MRNVVWLIFAMLLLIHHDFWWWDTYKPLVFGFIPISLAYHAGISIAACILWAMAVKFCWPDWVDDLDETVPSPGEAATSGGAIGKESTTGEGRV